MAGVEEGRGVYKVSVGNLRERNHWGNQDLDGRIILKWIFRKWEGVLVTGWILAEDTDRWRALVSTVMNFRVPYNAGNFLISCKFNQLASQEGLRSMD